MRKILFNGISALLFACCALPVVAELKPEPIPSVATLPATYPDSWIFAHDVNFNSMIAGKVAIIDVAADAKEFKGFIDASMMANFVESKVKPRLYVAESFFSRGTTGTRTDVISIYDKATLKRIKEVVLPKNNRAQIVASKHMLKLVDNDKYLLILAFTPATSVIVMDTDTGELLSELPIAGCNLVYPAGDKGFASLCGNGGMKAVAFDESGQETERYDIPPFFSVEDDPLFDKPAFIGSTAYFLSYKSQVQPIDLATSKPKILPTWSLVSDEEAAENWRPGGWQFATSDGAQKLYVVMHKDGYNGSHKFGGEEVWVFDTQSQQRIQRIALKKNAFSIEVTRSATPLLVVTNTEMGLDIYTTDGDYQRFISVGDSTMPIVLHRGR
ncbi:amine dehydrogenase large subunit [Alteromonas sp. C1M14]|uniref:amine dehydrogenase large subunit n=1 Tax=Alteromonas sp. C1M14 TaxID=2841567 RepID=UPI001C0801F5|nr:amine dehydrogenase large subunit [Alteromonas sp. C1M14]MBU2979606.1 amine dehydrogenase [Alteromonas sp. C1M14]